VKFKVRLQELEAKDSEAEVLNEWIDDAFRALVRLGSGGTMLKAAGRVIRAGIPLSLKAGDDIAQVINLLPQRMARDIADAAIGAANKAAEAGEAVIFQTKVGNTEDGRNIFMVFSVGPDGIQGVRTFEGVAGRRGELAALGREADKIIKGSDDAAAGGARAGDDVVDAGDDVVDAGEEAAEAGRRADDSAEAADEAKALADDIAAFYRAGRVRYVDEAEAGKIWNRRKEKVMDEWIEAGGKTRETKNVNIPMTDENGALIIIDRGSDSPRNVAFVELDSSGNLGKAFNKFGSHGETQQAVKAFKQVADALETIDSMRNDLGTLPSILRKYRGDDGWTARNAVLAVKEFSGKLARRLGEEMSQWFITWGPDRRVLNKLSMAAEIIGGGGFFRLGGAATSAILRTLGIARKAGVGGTATYATIVYWAAIVSYVASLFHLISSWGIRNVRDEEKRYKAALGANPALQEAYIVRYNGWLKQNDLPHFTKEEIISDKYKDDGPFPGSMDDMVNDIHQRWIEATVGARGVSEAQKIARTLKSPQSLIGIPVDVIDAAIDQREKNKQVTSLDTPEQDRIMSTEEEMKNGFEDMQAVVEKEFPQIAKKLNVKKPSKSELSEYDKDTGDRKPERGVEVEPEDRKKPALPTDDSPIGDLSGFDDSLFEIFNTGKSISIKVKSSSPRVRAKITEKK
jgi:hypothetical protein